MTAYRIVWEDEAKAREVELYVDYTVAEGTVQIDVIRPTKVTFYDPQTKQPVRSIGAHTQAGREILTRAYLASRPEQPTLEHEIQSQLELNDGTQAQEASCQTTV